MTNSNNYCVIMGEVSEADFGHIAAKISLSNSLISLVQDVLLSNRHSTDTRKSSH